MDHGRQYTVGDGHLAPPRPLRDDQATLKDLLADAILDNAELKTVESR
jgi:hypothetical protein